LEQATIAVAIHPRIHRVFVFLAMILSVSHRDGRHRSAGVTRGRVLFCPKEAGAPTQVGAVRPARGAIPCRGA
jgi:hypothetical protein